MKILNLYAGIGGNRKLWSNEHEITAIEINPDVASVYSKYYPTDTIIIGDAHEYLLNNYQNFDFVWASPPCQTHSAMSRVNHKRYNLRRYPDMKLWQEIIFLKEFFPGKWVVENVKPFYTELIPFKKIGRHCIWSNFPIGSFEKKNVKNFIDAKYDDLKKWLGYEDYTEKIYLNGNHDPVQVLRNCVHPDTGKYILDCALGVMQKQNIKQVDIFDFIK